MVNSGVCSNIVAKLEPLWFGLMLSWSNHSYAYCFNPSSFSGYILESCLKEVQKLEGVFAAYLQGKHLVTDFLERRLVAEPLVKCYWKLMLEVVTFREVLAESSLS